MKVKYFEWFDRRGIKHKIPDKSCVICKHRTDIFLDPLRHNEIYCVLCELSDDVGDPRICNRFEYADGYEGKEPKEMEVLDND